MRELFKGHQIFKSNTTQLQKYKKTTGCSCPNAFIFSDQIIYLGFLLRHWPSIANMSPQSHCGGEDGRTGLSS